MIYDIVVIGAGPAGMTAAITAAEKGSRVCIIEHKDRVGKKILSTGNGKCNITNMSISQKCYNSSSQRNFYNVIERFNPEAVRNFFMSIGLLTKEKNGYVYPNSEQASAVLDSLRYRLNDVNVHILTDTNVKKITYRDSYVITTDSNTINAKKLIIAAGSKCASKTGSDGSGYELAKSMGHKIVPVIPALVQIICRESFFKELQGIRCEALISVYSDGKVIISEKGELQLTASGISGIPVFCLSRHIKRLMDEKKQPYVSIDFMPSYSEAEVCEIIEKISSVSKGRTMNDILSGMLNKKLANLLAKLSNGKSIKYIAHLIKNFKVIPADTNGFENAQVCAGGVSLDEIDLNTMESEIVKNLYFAGEVLDVDGKCGGYNLQWAFSSGHLAGISAAEKKK